MKELDVRRYRCKWSNNPDASYWTIDCVLAHYASQQFLEVEFRRDRIGCLQRIDNCETIDVDYGGLVMRHEGWVCFHTEVEEGQVE